MKKINGMIRIFKEKVIKLIPDKVFLRYKYYRIMKKWLSFNNPKTFNEKIQWLKVYDRNEIYTNFVDKYEVRKFISKEFGDKYLIPLINVYDNVEEVNFNDLPKQFVLKCTHDSGGIVICKDKDLLNIDNAKKLLQNFIDRNYFYEWREWPYKNIKPRIICEKYMIDEKQQDIMDYKLMCFNGKVKCILVCSNRDSVQGVNMNFYDIFWNEMDLTRPKHKPKNGKIKKPINLEKMITMAEKIASEKPFIRVDFYEINEQLYFGEITLYPGAGFEKFSPEEYDNILGSWIELPNKKII